MTVSGTGSVSEIDFLFRSALIHKRVYFRELLELYDLHEVICTEQAQRDVLEQ